MSTSPHHTSGPLDRLFLRLGTITGFVLDFDGPAPLPEQLAARVIQRASSLPVLNLSPPAPGKHEWKPHAGTLTEAVHVRRSKWPGAEQDLDSATNAVLRQPMPSDPHPPWDLWLLPSGRRRFRICYRVHHALQDGVGAAHTLLTLLADRPTPGPHPHRAAAPTARGALREGWALTRSLFPRKAWPVLHQPPTHQTHWVCRDLPEACARKVAEAHGVTVNDVCLAALARALQHWHTTHMESTPRRADVHVLVPLSLRQDHERHAPGNRLSGLRLTLPSSAPDFGHAIHSVHRQTQRMRATRQRDVSRVTLRLMPSRLGEMAGKVFTAKAPCPLVTSTISLPAAFTCQEARLYAASMFNDLYGGRLGYISFTRAAGVIRCGMFYDNALPGAHTIPDLWSANLTSAVEELRQGRPGAGTDRPLR